MKKVIIFLFILTIIGLSQTEVSNQVLIPTDSIRYRIIANSNSIEDQALKQDLQTLINPIISDVLNSSQDITQARNNIKNSIPKIQTVLNNQNVSYDINYGQNYFPEKIYKDVVYSAGSYESLVITLGEGLGDNWWCVLFPPLCLLEAKEETVDEVNYAFFIKEIVDKFY